MLRASRREDRKRVPQYSSAPCGPDVRESSGKRQWGADQAPGGVSPPEARFRPATPSREILREFYVVGMRHARPRGSETELPNRRVPERY
ncbi:hypothetical protein GCM10010327_00140 [Streptomyces nitrosporeus]|nr:hypothetical protein GCM10010327_00140 [Streptomyces nitrosporeus]